MVRRRVWLVRLAISLTLWSIVCWACPGEAYEPWKGRVTARVNVRQAPGETSTVMTHIDEGVEVTVSDERNGWYKVVVDKDSFGFMGWVYGKYVRKSSRVSSASSLSVADRKKPEIPPLTSATQTASHGAPTETAPKDRRVGGTESGETFGRSTPAKEKVSPVVTQNAVAMESHTERPGNVTHHASQKKSFKMNEMDPPALGKGELPGDRLPPYEVPLQKVSAEAGTRRTLTPAPSASVMLMSQGVPSEKRGNGPAKKLSVPSRKIDPVIAVPEAKPYPETKAIGVDNSRHGHGMKVLAGVVVKLVVVAFSCLALIFAYRAWEKVSARKG